MAHENLRIRNFIDEIEKGNYVIPHFQRDFDWKPNMVNDLFQSILHNYYAGTILLWNLQDSERELKMWDALWGAEKSERPTKAILDGQQRLSSIYYALCAPKKTFPERQSYFYFFINLDKHFEGIEDESIENKIFKHYRDRDSFKKDENLINEGLFPLCLLSDEDFLTSKDYQNWVNKYVEQRKSNSGFKETILTVSETIKSILSYHFLTETLENKEVKEICTIFANINSKGLRLDIFDLMNAFLYPQGIELRKNWETLTNNELKNIDPQMKTYILKLMSLYKQKYCSTKYLYNLIPGSTIKDRSGKKTILVSSSDDFKKLWDHSIDYSERARKRIMNSGISDYGAIKPQFIPNTTIIPVLGALLLNYEQNMKQIISENEFWTKIKKWYWCAVISGDYSGSSDSVMAKDYEEIVEWLNDDNKVPQRVKEITHSISKVKLTNFSIIMVKGTCECIS
jgi:uncharacterized protein with ParB-like and HNH nuclease domain